MAARSPQARYWAEVRAIRDRFEVSTAEARDRWRTVRDYREEHGGRFRDAVKAWSPQRDYWREVREVARAAGVAPTAARGLWRDAQERHVETGRSWRAAVAEVTRPEAPVEPPPPVLPGWRGDAILEEPPPPTEPPPPLPEPPPWIDFVAPEEPYKWEPTPGTQEQAFFVRDLDVGQGGIDASRLIGQAEVTAAITITYLDHGTSSMVEGEFDVTFDPGSSEEEFWRNYHAAVRELLDDYLDDMAEGGAEKGDYSSFAVFVGGIG